MTGIERLREFVDGVSPITVVCGVTKDAYDREHMEAVGVRLRDFLADIVDQIKREHAEDCFRMGERAAEDADAIAWVREHGGIAYVKDICHDFRAVVERLGIEWSESELHGLMDALDRRLMPEGMEWLVEAWPRFESGEPVRIGDLFAEHVGCENVTGSIEIGDCWFKIHGFDGAAPRYSKGAFVKRPTPKVLDADGVECSVGDAVWWVSNKAGNFRIVRIETDGKCAIYDDDEDEPCGMTVLSTELTHVRPALDADGAEIRVGDKLYDTETGCGRTVRAINANGTIEFDGHDDRGWFANRLTHRAPVLAADGKPLRVGETVWYLDHVDPLEVRSVSTTSSCGSYVNAYNDYEGEVSAPARCFSHKRHDSWERLEEDAGKNPFDYCKDVGHRLDTCENSEAYKARDLVRRAKALAGDA